MANIYPELTKILFDYYLSMLMKYSGGKRGPQAARQNNEIITRSHSKE